MATPMTMVGDWEQLDPLGEGGQGKVYRARRPHRVKDRADAVRRMIENPPGGIFTAEERREKVDAFATAVWSYARPDDVSEIGALKIFKLDGDRDKHELREARKRFNNEVRILGENKLGLIKLLDSNDTAGWIVTEYMPGGTVADHPEKFRGDALGTLKAFRSLVQTVALLHEEKTVHRDIKPMNVFLGDDRLVLGDFGIVFLPDQVERPTVTNERVGSRDYMPPWADLGERFDDVSPDFDVYMLGKLLWCMVSGRLKLPREDFKKERFNLTAKFPDDPNTHAVNDLLERCVVSEQKDCLPSANELLPLVDAAISRMERKGQLLRDGVPRPCHICGEGFYLPFDGEGDGLKLRIWRGTGSDPFTIPIRVFICNSCHNVELFNTKQ